MVHIGQVDGFRVVWHVTEVPRRAGAEDQDHGSDSSQGESQGAVGRGGVGLPELRPEAPGVARGGRRRVEFGGVGADVCLKFVHIFFRKLSASLARPRENRERSVVSLRPVSPAISS